MTFDFVHLAILLPLFVASITLHEFGHAITADLLGDDTPRREGRISLNPIVHLDLFGTLFLVLAGFGWAKPVNVNIENLRWPRLGNFLVSAAGPFMNFILAIAAVLAFNHIPGLNQGAQLWLYLAISLNVMLMLFNLLPIPPLDGSHLVEAMLPRKWVPQYQNLIPYGMVFLLVLVLVPGAFTPIHAGVKWTTNLLMDTL